MMVRAVIAEDEPLARRKLRELIGELSWIAVVGEAADGKVAVEMIDSLKPDVVFLDIQMPELNGLEVLDRIQHDPAVVFTTAFDRYAVSAFELEAVDYLLKPFGRERLHAALERVRRTLESTEPHPDTPRLRDRVADAIDGHAPVSRLLVRDRGRLVPVAVADIERLEAADDYVTVVANGRRHLVYITLGDFERRLDPARFLRVHRSHIVNVDHVTQMRPHDGSRMEIVMRDGMKILASRARSKELRRRAL